MTMLGLSAHESGSAKLLFVCVFVVERRRFRRIISTCCVMRYVKDSAGGQLGWKMLAIPEVALGRQLKMANGWRCIVLASTPFLVLKHCIFN